VSGILGAQKGQTRMLIKMVGWNAKGVWINCNDEVKWIFGMGTSVIIANQKTVNKDQNNTRIWWDTTILV